MVKLITRNGNLAIIRNNSEFPFTVVKNFNNKKKCYGFDYGFFKKYQEAKDKYIRLINQRDGRG